MAFPNIQFLWCWFLITTITKKLFGDWCQSQKNFLVIDVNHKKNLGNHWKKLASTEKRQEIRNVIFLFEIQIIFYRSWDKKNFCTASRLFWPEARFEGFFGLREAVRPLEGQKIPRNGPKAKRVWTKCKTCFCPWSYKIWSVLSVKCNLSPFSPFSLCWAIFFSGFLFFCSVIILR